MPLEGLIVRDAILPQLYAATKKQALLEMSARAGALSGVPEREIFAALMRRENLGSTGFGNGIAIPHGTLGGVDHIFGVFARLERPLNFESLDGLPVDLIFMIVAPETAGASSLAAQAKVARALRNPELTNRLRTARDSDALFALFLTHRTPSNAA